MVTLKDVAKAAGVSCSTVSAVLGNRAEKLGIKPETRKLVQRTAARMRYRRNAIAAQMKSGQANTLAMILPEGGTPEFVMRAATAATVEAEKHGCFMKIIAANGKEDFITRLDSVLSQCPAALLHRRPGRNRAGGRASVRARTPPNRARDDLQRGTVRRRTRRGISIGDGEARPAGENGMDLPG